MLALLQVQADSVAAGTSWGDYFQVMGALLFILVLLVVAMRYVLPLLPATRGASAGLIRVRATMPLEPRKRLYLVESGGRMLLLASADHAVTLVGTFAPADFPEAPADPSPVSKFAHLLKRGRP